MRWGWIAGVVILLSVQKRSVGVTLLSTDAGQMICLLKNHACPDNRGLRMIYYYITRCAGSTQAYAFL